MKTTVHVSLHNLDADDIGTTMMHENRHLSVCIGNAGTQMHWDSFDAFETWIDRLHSLMAYEHLLAEGVTA